MRSAAPMISTNKPTSCTTKVDTTTRSTLLKEGISLYPLAVELHIGSAYAYLAREEYAWSRRSFERALALDPDHEDGLAGLGEVLLKLGERGGALRTFERVVLLGFKDDHELMLQVGRALFRESLIGPAQRFFDFAAAAQPESPDASACLGYACHRLGNDAGALFYLRRALELEPTLCRGADLPGQHAVRPRGNRGRAPPPGAHPARRSLRRAGHLAHHRAAEVDLPAARRRSRAAALAHPAGRGRRRPRRRPSCCSPRSRRSSPTAPCAIRTSSSCSAPC